MLWLSMRRELHIQSAYKVCSFKDNMGKKLTLRTFWIHADILYYFYYERIIIALYSEEKVYDFHDFHHN